MEGDATQVAVDAEVVRVVEQRPAERAAVVAVVKQEAHVEAEAAAQPNRLEAVAAGSARERQHARRAACQVGHGRARLCYR